MSVLGSAAAAAWAGNMSLTWRHAAGIAGTIEKIKVLEFSHGLMGPCVK